MSNLSQEPFQSWIKKQARNTIEMKKYFQDIEFRSSLDSFQIGSNTYIPSHHACEFYDGPKTIHEDKEQIEFLVNNNYQSPEYHSRTYQGFISKRDSRMAQKLANDEIPLDMGKLRFSKDQGTSMSFDVEIQTDRGKQDEATQSENQRDASRRVDCRGNQSRHCVWNQENCRWNAGDCRGIQGNCQMNQGNCQMNQGNCQMNQGKVDDDGVPLIKKQIGSEEFYQLANRLLFQPIELPGKRLREIDRYDRVILSMKRRKDSITLAHFEQIFLEKSYLLESEFLPVTMKIFGLPFFMNSILYKRILQSQRKVTLEAVKQFYDLYANVDHSELVFFNVLRQNRCNFITATDIGNLVETIVKEHPKLSHFGNLVSFYAVTVFMRIIHELDYRQCGKITLSEFKNSSLVSSLQFLGNMRNDVNLETHFFSPKHFLTLYFLWNRMKRASIIDEVSVENNKSTQTVVTDRNVYIVNNLMEYIGVSRQIAQRIVDGFGIQNYSQVFETSSFNYPAFLYFIFSEYNTTNDSSIRYWWKIFAKGRNFLNEQDLSDILSDSLEQLQSDETLQNITEKGLIQMIISDYLVWKGTPLDFRDLDLLKIDFQQFYLSILSNGPELIHLQSNVNRYLLDDDVDLNEWLDERFCDFYHIN